MARRVISIFCYVVAGLFLASEGVVAFIADEASAKAEALLISAALAAVPLGIGAAISPGRRLREAGIVLLAGAGWVVLTILSFAYISVRKDMREMLPPDIFDIFGDHLTGGINFALMAGLGLFLFVRGGRAGRAASGR